MAYDHFLGPPWKIALVLLPFTTSEMKFSPIPALRKALKETLRKRGYEVIGARSIGVDPFRDMPLFLGQQRRPVIFDVGANVGQTVEISSASCRSRGFMPSSRVLRRSRSSSAIPQP